MPLKDPIIAELQHEAANTRKMLERVPEDKHSWKPHEKSMTLGRLASHVAELPMWVVNTVENDELDFAKGEYKPFFAETNKELLKTFDDSISKSIEALKKATDENLMGNWKLRSGDQVYFEMPRVAVIRAMVLSHLIHHRGQLSVYLRLQEVPLPSVYGPTADESM